MTRHFIWDPLVRVFHWSLAAGFLANALITDPETGLHRSIGFAIAGIVLLRILWGFVGPHSARFASFLPTRNGLRRQMTDMATGRRRVHLLHTPLGALMIFNLLATMSALALTGWMSTTGNRWGGDPVEEVHEALVAWAAISVVLHVGAVIFESRRTGVNLPRAMVTGVKSVPDGANIEA
ncbi:cytochrome b/b6 domain-containing protein [Salipiger sp.]|uniref:cytochrome b/b6 domain-containing protein n=1 Tax=Salipiger sp. TaxID=2078585 RepID=UPI003A9779FC